MLLILPSVNIQRTLAQAGPNADLSAKSAAVDVDEKAVEEAIEKVRNAKEELFQIRQKTKKFKKVDYFDMTPQERQTRYEELQKDLAKAKFNVSSLSSTAYRLEAVKDSKYFDTFEEDYVDGSRIEFFGSGAIQRVISEEGELPASTGLGALYDRIFRQPTFILGIRRIEVAININVASTVDTVAAALDSLTSRVTNLNNLGNAILLPINSGRAATAYARLYFDPTSWFHNPANAVNLSGFQIRLTGSSRIWRMDTIVFTPNASIVKRRSRGAGEVSTTVLSGRIGLFHDFLPNRPELRKDFSITVGADYSWRWLFSDIGVGNEGEQLRKQFLNGSSRQTFHGIESYLNIRLKNIRAEVSIPILFANDANQIKGLTGGQFVTSITFIGGFPIKIDTNKKPAPVPSGE